MKIVILDYPTTTQPCPQWTRLEAIASVDRYDTTTLPELLKRAQTAEVLVTWNFPFRREVLDYITRPRMILVPVDRMEELVELPIAQQLGIAVRGFETGATDPCRWIDEVAFLLEDSE